MLTVLADSLPAGCTKGSAASCPRVGAEKASKRNLLMVSWFLLEDGAHEGCCVYNPRLCLSARQERPRRLLALWCTRLLQFRQLLSVGWVMCVVCGSASVSFLDGVSVVVRCCMRLVAPSFVLTQHAGCFDVCLHEGLRPCEQGEVTMHTRTCNAHTDTLGLDCCCTLCGLARPSICMACRAQGVGAGGDVAVCSLHTTLLLLALTTAARTAQPSGDRQEVAHAQACCCHSRCQHTAAQPSQKWPRHTALICLPPHGQVCLRLSSHDMALCCLLGVLCLSTVVRADTTHRPSSQAG